MLGVSRITVWKRIKRHGIDLKTEIRSADAPADGTSAAGGR
jgi:hypothetical protein